MVRNLTQKYYNQIVDRTGKECKTNELGLLKHEVFIVH
jgi:hypothetical protein